jgi:hypothetical protein
VLDPDILRAAGLPICRIYNADRTKFCEAFGRERTLRRPIELLHLDLHTNAQGVEFTNGRTAPTWCIRHSELLRVVVLAHHAVGEAVPACFAAVPFVVTLTPLLPPAAAESFTRGFWLAIAAGAPPLGAFTAAVAPLPPAARTHITHHAPPT